MRIDAVELLDGGAAPTSIACAPATRSPSGSTTRAHEPVADPCSAWRSNTVEGVARDRARTRGSPACAAIACSGAGHVDFRIPRLLLSRRHLRRHRGVYDPTASHPYDHVERTVPLRRRGRRPAARRTASSRSAALGGRGAAPAEIRERARLNAGSVTRRGSSSPPVRCSAPSMAGPAIRAWHDRPRAGGRARRRARRPPAGCDLPRIATSRCRSRRRPSARTLAAGRRRAWWCRATLLRHASELLGRRGGWSSTCTTRSTSRRSSRRAALDRPTLRASIALWAATSVERHAVAAGRLLPLRERTPARLLARAPRRGRSRQRAHLRRSPDLDAADHRRAVRRRGRAAVHGAHRRCAASCPASRPATTSCSSGAAGSTTGSTRVTLLHAVDRLRRHEPARAPVLRRRAPPEPARRGDRDGAPRRARSPTTRAHRHARVLPRLGRVRPAGANFLLEADIGVSTHVDHVETAFSFRTRILDYLWAVPPVVTTTGDDARPTIDRRARRGIAVAARRRRRARSRAARAPRPARAAGRLPRRGSRGARPATTAGRRCWRRSSSSAGPAPRAGPRRPGPRPGSRTAHARGARAGDPRAPPAGRLGHLRQRRDLGRSWHKARNRFRRRCTRQHPQRVDDGRDRAETGHRTAGDPPSARVRSRLDEGEPRLRARRTCEGWVNVDANPDVTRRHLPRRVRVRAGARARGRRALHGPLPGAPAPGQRRRAPRADRATASPRVRRSPRWCPTCGRSSPRTTRGEITNDELNERFVYSYEQPSHHVWCYDADSLRGVFAEAGFARRRGDRPADVGAGASGRKGPSRAGSAVRARRCRQPAPSARVAFAAAGRGVHRASASTRGRASTSCCCSASSSSAPSSRRSGHGRDRARAGRRRARRPDDVRPPARRRSRRGEGVPAPRAALSGASPGSGIDSLRATTRATSSSSSTSGSHRRCARGTPPYYLTWRRRHDADRRTLGPSACSRPRRSSRWASTCDRGAAPPTGASLRRDAPAVWRADWGHWTSLSSALETVRAAGGSTASVRARHRARRSPT